MTIPLPKGNRGESGTDGTFSDICLTRLVWLIMIGDFQRRETSRLSPRSVPPFRPPAPGSIRSLLSDFFDNFPHVTCKSRPILRLMRAPKGISESDSHLGVVGRKYPEKSKGPETYPTFFWHPFRQRFIERAGVSIEILRCELYPVA